MLKFGSKRHDKIIILIHGLGNKPPRRLLRKWYFKSIQEGLSQVGSNLHHHDFELVYWADLLYSKPLDPIINTPDHPLYIDEPYVPSQEMERDLDNVKLRKKIFKRLEKVVDKVFLSKNSFINAEYIFDFIISWNFKDLHTYYRKKVKVDEKSENAAKRVIRKRLTKVLAKHKDKKILLIAHSMGSIISYDVLTRFSEDVQINTLVTVGSPLGLSMIKREISKENGITFTKNTMLPTPKNIRRAWYNIADVHDHVATNHRLNDDYAPNQNNISPEDITVENDYQYQGKVNPHKSFGYLRTPPMAKIIDEFLHEKESNIMERFMRRFKGVFKAMRKETEV
ncbi:alpha/beta hydrolase [Fulvivirgaceae bacterium BMA10]|uniref:Alpha/beta hydrolase n=1 Tax=Splendidivirga corallicola TaxID=3051826 RepID=A0ABT8KWH0_9BACT|nr:alpha/beta hydrolase [Fulvivirgaceae bacterium BMA10]